MQAACQPRCINPDSYIYLAPEGARDAWGAYERSEEFVDYLIHELHLKRNWHRISLTHDTLLVETPVTGGFVALVFAAGEKICSAHLCPPDEPCAEYDMLVAELPRFQIYPTKD